MLSVKRDGVGRAGRGDIANVLVEMNGLPMAGEAYIVATPPVAAPPSRDAAPPRPEAAPTPAAPAASSAPTLPPPSFPVSLQFDQETHRFFIEARDVSGLVVYQVPFKSVVPASAGTARGQRLNSKA